MTELLITSSLDPIKEGQVFSGALPRHVTVWQYFDLPDSHMNEFIAESGDAIEAFPTLGVEGAEYAEFGAKNNVPVRLLKVLGEHATLLSLHASLGAVIEKYDADILQPEWAYDGYKPHITYKDGRALEEGDYVLLNSVELIQKDTNTKSKIVRKIWELGDA